MACFSETADSIPEATRKSQVKARPPQIEGRTPPPTIGQDKTRHNSRWQGSADDSLNRLRKCPLIHKRGIKMMTCRLMPQRWGAPDRHKVAVSHPHHGGQKDHVDGQVAQRQKPSKAHASHLSVLDTNPARRFHGFILTAASTLDTANPLPRCYRRRRSRTGGVVRRRMPCRFRAAEGWLRES